MQFSWKKDVIIVSQNLRKRKTRNARLRIRLLAVGLMSLITRPLDC